METALVIICNGASHACTILETADCPRFFSSFSFSFSFSFSSVSSLRSSTLVLTSLSSPRCCWA